MLVVLLVEVFGAVHFSLLSEIIINVGIDYFLFNVVSFRKPVCNVFLRNFYTIL